MKAMKLMLVCLLALFIMLPRAAEAAWQPQLAIGLEKGHEAINIRLPQGGQACLGTSSKPVKEFSAGSQLSITCRGGHLLLNGKQMKGSEIIIKAGAGQEQQNYYFTFNQNDYRGSAKVIIKNGKLTLINLIDTEDYLAGVVPEEMPSSWHKEALKAQALAARTYALQNRGRHEADGFDLCSNTHCQQYLGMKSETQAATKALEDTRGEVLVYQGQLIEALFHTDSGGMTENSEDVWGSHLPYLRAAEEAEKYTKAWKNTFNAERIASLVSKQGGKDIGELKEIRLSTLKIGKSAKDRSASGRVKQAVFVGRKGQVTISGNDLRSLLGLRSTMFNMVLKHKQVLVEGYGWGHGLGMSQWGAKALAERNKTYSEILFHYYQNTAIKKLY